MRASILLIDYALEMDHVEWETMLFIGDIEYFRSKDHGPFPNHQFRVSVRPSAGVAALNYMNHDDAEDPIVNSYDPTHSLPEIDLIFDGETGATFPRSAVIPINDARRALIEWLETRKRPRCIEWLPCDAY